MFQSETLVIALASVTAFPEGAEIGIRMTARRVEGVNDDTWEDQHDVLFGHRRHRFRPGQSLDDSVIRFGVRFPDGSKATTLDDRPGRYESPPPRPEGPILDNRGGGSGSGSSRSANSSWKLWLWPLPPPEPFEFAVEWPAFGVPLTFTEIDGAAIATAAGQAQPYWP
ncbi:hypothetical protein [Streptosporangium carneum]|uniref:hypothetical protein n=1 Tax=Streptosporangium carneum TaxID=47481 RepID=UPI0022F3121D|nr:hypothetical protein [Streptosporangium carneum]